MPIPLGKKNSVIEVSYPCLIFFKSTFCSNCLFSRKMLTDALKKEELGDYIFEVDIARNTKVAKQFEIRTVPTTLILDSKGRVIGGIEGPLTKKSISAMTILLKKLLEQ